MTKTYDSESAQKKAGKEFMKGFESDGLALDYIFHPRSVAIIGTANNPSSAGQAFLKCFHSFGFNGNVYPVHPEESEIGGMKCYPSVKDIPEPVDYAFVAIPARSTPQFMEECVIKGVKVVSFYTAGFSESSESGKELEIEVMRIARQSGVRIIGPNCIGIYCPSVGLSFCSDFSRQSGPVGLLCQSGGNTCYLVRALNARGIHISKAVGYGNAADINETELLEYFTHDSETKIIAAYIEGIGDVKQFFKVLKEAAKTKPVIILKGGRTEIGATTAASHTSALACSADLWDTLINQAGAIQVNAAEELVDVVSVFTHMSLPAGRRLGIIGVGGGASVLSADACINAGLSLPQLPEEIKERLRGLTTAAGNIFNNPVDSQCSFIGTEAFAKTVRIVNNSGQLDILLLHIAYDQLPGIIQTGAEFSMYTPPLQTWIDTVKEIGKPAAVVLHYTTTAQSLQEMCRDREICSKAGMPVFYSMSGAANAINSFLSYYEKSVHNS